MSRTCTVCGKGPQIGYMVSHAHNRSKKWVYPNLQKLRFMLKSSGTNHVHRGNVCTKCIKAQKIVKVI